MSRNKSTRSACSTQLGEVRYPDVESLYRDETDKLVRQAPTGVAVLGRVQYLTKTFHPNGSRVSRSEAYKQVATELSSFWIFGLNIYPLSDQAIETNIQKTYEYRRKLYKHMSNKDEIAKFEAKMLTGYDVRTKSAARQKALEEQYKVKMKPEDYQLYEDNCKVKTCNCSLNVIIKCKDCPRQMISSDTVDEQWKKWLERKEKTAKRTAQKSQDTEIYTDHSDMDIEEQEGDISDDYVAPHSPRTSKYVNPDELKFPQVPLRYGRKHLNAEVMRCFVHVQSTCKVSDRDCEKIFVCISNMVYHQNWELSDADEFLEEDSDYDSDDELDKTTLRSKRSDSPPPKKRRSHKTLTYTFPSRQARREYMEDGAILNLKYVADKIVKKDDGQVVTWRFDDTTKSAGHHKHDVKTSNITINSDDKKREVFTTGFTPNSSHKGDAQAETMKHSMEVLAVLAGNRAGRQLTVEELMEYIDYWISDRAADTSVALDHLHIPDDKRLLCCGHTTLTVDEGVDYVLKDSEVQIGKDKLIGPEIGAKALNGKNSVVVSGLIAIAKGLSPSHANLPYSMYSLYKTWRAENKLEHKEFKGFQSNRFGRTSYLAELFLKHKPDLIKFFEEVVDESSNLLVVAMVAYINSEWFEVGCRVFAEFGRVIIRPLCELLGIDEAKKEYREDRNWFGVKKFYEEKLEELDKMTDYGQGEGETNVDRLIGKCAEKVKENLARQVNQMTFLRPDGDTPEHADILLAPLTNSGCESRMAQLDVRLKHCGGSAPIKTVSNKQIVAVNKFLLTDEAQSSSEELFKWARTSAESKAVKKLQKEFLASVEEKKSLIIASKKQEKKKKAERMFKLLEKCKEHGGPVTPSNVHTLDDMTDKDIILEAQYLKAMQVCDIKLRKRGKTDPITGKYTMIDLPIEQIKKEIKVTLNPVSGAVATVEMLLGDMFKTGST